MANKKENFDIAQLQFDEKGLLPVIVQDYESGEVIMLLQANAEAVEKTFSTGYTYFYNTAENTVEKYGMIARNTQKVVTAFAESDGSVLLLKVRQSGQADDENNAHTRFSKQLLGEYKDIGGEMFGRLQRLVAEYKKNPEEGTYTSFLFVRGVDRIAKKVGEEAVELVIAAKNGEKEGVVNEASDLLYHLMVLLCAKDVKLSEVCAELCKRNR